MSDDARFTELPDEPVHSPAPDRLDVAPSDDADADEAGSSPVARAQNLKADANEAFAASRVDDAIQLYVLALSELPERPAPPKPAMSSRKGKERERDGADSPVAPVDERGESAEAPTPEPAEPESADVIALRATLHANLAACYVKTVREHGAHSMRGGPQSRTR